MSGAQIANKLCARPEAEELRLYPKRSSPPWVDLFLDANEGRPPSGVLERLSSEMSVESLSRYPQTDELEAEIAAKYGIDPARVVVTGGGDDAIDRVCRVSLGRDRCLLQHSPTFEMIERSAERTGAGVVSVEWVDGAFPLSEMIERIDRETGLVAVVSPNNPTGGVVNALSIKRLAKAAGEVGALVLVDLAYAEFAETDPTAELLDVENVCIVRTFSKAYGLAGLRVGYVVAPEAMATGLRAAGGPYPVSTLGVSAARFALKAAPAVRASVDAVRAGRARITAALRASGLRVLDSEANFVYVLTEKSAWLNSAFASLGIAVRMFEGASVGAGAVRISVPQRAGDLERLERAIETIFRPQAVLFDLDGVLADVSGSYREAIVRTAESFGVRVSREELQALKDAGDANNDWVVTQRVLENAGVRVPFDEVVARFQGVYLGDAKRPGLREGETLLTERKFFASLGTEYRLAVVTGRPRNEAVWFLQRFGIEAFFDAVICMDDAPAKPSPEPVRLALEALGVRSAWMVGDTPDDIRSARGAGVLPIGMVPPGDDAKSARAVLASCGAARVLSSVEKLREMLP